MEVLSIFCRLYVNHLWYDSNFCPQPQHMPQLVDFVRYLTEAMHREKPGSTVIWYDSVIQDGSLKWQDMLNNLNRYVCWSELIFKSIVALKVILNR